MRNFFISIFCVDVLWINYIDRIWWVTESDVSLELIKIGWEFAGGNRELKIMKKWDNFLLREMDTWWVRYYKYFAMKFIFPWIISETLAISVEWKCFRTSHAKSHYFFMDILETSCISTPLLLSAESYFY